MQAVMSQNRAAFTRPGAMPMPCLSSWLTWICYWVAFSIACTPQVEHELAASGFGLFVLIAGVAAFFASVVAIQRHMNLSLRANSFGTPQRLVTTGAFRYSRNPIYVAFLMPLASLAYFSPAAALLGIAAYVTVSNIFVIRGEERVLEERFGADYLRYKRSVPRWIA